MSLEKIILVYNEFQAIQNLVVGKKQEIIDDGKKIAINLYTGFTLELLKDLDGTVQHFEVHCNPFSQPCEEIIEDIRCGNKSIDEVESISILIEKDINFDRIENLDYFFMSIESALDFIGKIKKDSNGNKINIGIPYCEPVETELLNIISLDPHTTQIVRKKVNKVIDKNVNLYLNYNKKGTQGYYLNPYAFILVNDNDDKSHKLIKRHFYLTALEGISDKIENNTFVIRGKKNIQITKSGEFDTNNYQDFVNILNFLMSEEKYMEKYLITKKVFSYYIADEEDISGLDNKMPNIRKTIRHYYNHYIEDDIKDFFKTKDQLLKEAMNVSKVIYEQTDKVITSITASLISVILILVTTLYRMIQLITVTYFLVILITFLIFSVVFYYLTKSTSEKRYKLTKSQFEYFMNEMSLLKKIEIESLQSTYLEKPYNEMKNTILMLKYILITFNIFLIFSFFIFLYISGYFCLCSLN